MSDDFRIALAVFCSHYHGGQWSRLYRLMCRCRVRVSDSAEKAISGNRHDKLALAGAAAWNEWEVARCFYRQLKRSKYAKETR